MSKDMLVSIGEDTISLSVELRKKLAGYLQPEAAVALSPDVDEALDVVGRVILEYLQDIEANPDDILSKPHEACSQLKRVATTLKAAAEAIENKVELMTETSAAARSIEALNPIFSTALALDLSDEVLNSSRAPEPDELLAYARKADDLARYFGDQPSHRKQKPLYRRDVLMRFLVVFFWERYSGERLGVDGRGWDGEFLDNCERFIHCVLTEAGIPCPKSAPDRAGRLGEDQQGRLRRHIKDHLRNYRPRRA